MNIKQDNDNDNGKQQQLEGKNETFSFSVQNDSCNKFFVVIFSPQMLSFAVVKSNGCDEKETKAKGYTANSIEFFLVFI